ncbi:hypothetical protein [Nocardia sp. NBC_00511]|uniref:hypothetical protein n=1 Tax=Nocardia sp. NBC_00511 TaxID=2903591 RepID=UPI0030DE6E08
MTRKKLTGVLVGGFVCAALLTMTPSAAYGSGEIGGPAAPAPGAPANTPAGVVPERIVPVPAAPGGTPGAAPGPGAGMLCPTP